MNTCRLFGGVLFFLAVLSIPADAQIQYAQNPADQRLTTDVLSKTLYARTPEQEAFLGKCIDLRDSGVLPDRILYTAYRYAMKKQKTRRYDYFKTALEKLCKENRITLE